MAGAAAYQLDESLVGEIRYMKAADVEPDRYDSHLVRELHDGVAQDLATMLLELEHFRSVQTGRASVQNTIGQLQDQLRMTLSNIRSLIYDQRSMQVDDVDFTGAIRRGIVQRFSERTGIEVRVSVAKEWPRVIRTDASLNLHRIVQEALNNISRHSGATRARIRFGVNAAAGMGVIEIRDNGRGYPGLGEEWRAGLGLLGITERAILLGARATVSNLRQGSRLTLTLPLSSVVS